MNVCSRFRAWILGVVLACAVAWPAADISAVPLSNTPVTQAQVQPFFALNLCCLALIDGNNADVHIFTGVRAGISGTAAEGLFLYAYFLEDGGGGADVRRFSVPFDPLVAFNFTGSGASTSAFCSNCTNGTVDPSSSDLAGGIVSYDFPNGIGRFASDLFLVSNVGPAAISATLTMSNGSTFPITVLAPSAPVPEPTTLVLVLGGALIGVGRLARRRA